MNTDVWDYDADPRSYECRLVDNEVRSIAIQHYKIGYLDGMDSQDQQGIQEAFERGVMQGYKEALQSYIINGREAANTSA